MEGFGVHTFRLTNAAGETTLVKFHWKPRLGVHSLTWEEAQLLGGIDPDFHRRDLYDAIEAGAYPQYELGIQAFEDTPDQTFEGIDLLDPTKLVPEELAPVQPIGLLTLSGTPTNFFAESEQVAFHVGNLVPGIDVTDDPLLQVRLFSYVDTQLTRLGGPNFNQLPVNRPHAPVNDMLRDGLHQTAVHGGVAPYRPNSLDGGCPFVAGDAEGAFLDVPSAVAAGTKVRELSASFDDHFSQARLFWLSMSAVEQDHIVQAYTFELGKCYDDTIRQRQLLALARIDGGLAADVATGLGMPAPEPAVDAEEVTPSPALSQLGDTWPVEGRTVAVVVDATADADAVLALTEALRAERLVPLLLAPTGGPVWPDRDLPAHRTLLTARSVEFDAVVVAAVLAPAADARQSRDAKAAAGATPSIDPRLTLLVDEAFRHGKGVGVLGDADAAAMLGLSTDDAAVSIGDAAAVAAGVVEGLAQHRAWDRFTPSR
jgi:catalase